MPPLQCLQQRERRKRLTKALPERERFCAVRFIKGQHVDIQGRRLRRGSPKGFDKQGQALQAHGKADARGGTSAKPLYQAIIASPTADRPLRTQGRGGPLEDRVRVVVETPNNPRIHHVGNGQRIK